MSNMITTQLRGRFLNAYMQIEEPSTHKYAFFTVSIVAIMIFTSLAWAYVTPVAEMARTRGEVIPAGLPHRIQFPAGGRIEDMHVNTGAHVSKGDLLVSLSPTTVKAELDQVRTRHAILTLEQERISALMEDRQPEFKTSNDFKHLITQQIMTYEQQRKSFQDRKNSLLKDISQKQVEHQRFKNQVRALSPRLAALKDKMRIFDRLRESDAIAEVSRIDVRADLAQVEAEMSEALSASNVALSAIDSARSRLEELNSEIRQNWSLRASEISSQLAEIEQDRIEFDQRVKEMDVYSPIDGVIKISEVAGVNGVVGAGEIIMEVIPIQDQQIISTLLPTKDIGHVTVGQRAQVQLDGFDNRQSDWLEGKVAHLSASSYLDADGVPHYYAKIELKQQHVENKVKRVSIVPGMTGNVQIMTGEKTVMEYLLKPITRGFSSALQER